MSKLFSKQGVQPDREIAVAIKSGMIRAKTDITDDQIQPASLDLRLGDNAWRLRASFLPGKKGIAPLLRGDDILYRLDLSDGAVLETNCVYLVELQERLNLPKGVRARANPKSSIGRIDVFTRLVTANAKRFDTVPDGYAGPLYAEVLPCTFPIKVRRGDRLNQLRFLTGESGTSRSEELGLDLRGEVCGYRARHNSDIIDLARIGAHASDRYWEAVRAHNDRIILDPGEFYILASRKAVRIKTTEAAEMVPIAPEYGEFRAHYAGFFDPGFGMDGDSRAVLEMRSRDAPFILEHGQIVARLSFEKMASRPTNRYGSNATANYQGQGLRLAKYFR